MSRRVAFGSCEIDPTKRLLLQHGQPVEIQAKAFDLLLHLIEHRDRVVSAAELLDALWPDTAVTPGALSRAVHKARQAVDDDGEAQRVIATVHGHGFRFVAEPHPARDDTSSGELGSGLVAGRQGLAQLERIETPSATQRIDASAMCSIAVLPFSNLSRDEEAGVFASGLVEEILDELSRGEYYRLYSRWPLKVASRTASSQFADRAEDVSVIAQRLGVGYVVEGSVRRIANSLRVTAQLIRAEDGFHVWSKSYERPVTDDFEMQTRLAQNIAHLVVAELLFDLWKKWALREGGRYARLSPAAVEHFFKAEYQYRQIRLGEGGDWPLYEQLLRRAVEADPGFADAHSMLAFVYMKRIGGRLPLDRALAAAHASISKALALAPDDIMALWQLGEIQMNLDLDYARAESTFKAVLERSPGRIWVHYNLAAIALREGRTREALRLLITASALDAGYEHAGFLNSYAWLLNVVGHYEESLKISAKGLGLAWGGQERATNLRNQAHALIGLERIEEAGPLIAESWDLSGPLNPESHAFLFAKIGEKERARRILEDARDDSVDRHALALGYLVLGDLDATFDAIEKGIEDHDAFLVESLRTADWWKGIRDDPRYRKVIGVLDSKETHTEQSSRRAARRLPS